MPVRGAGAVDNLPEDLKRKIDNVRATGKGPRACYTKLREELEKHHVTVDHLRGYFYRRDDGRAVDTPEFDHLGKIADLLERSGISPDDIGKVAVHQFCWDKIKHLKSAVSVLKKLAALGFKEYGEMK